ncbi:ExbD/TolR family protein [Pseudomarimonas salicorniae]|uniref:Biopolymer transporter ExbD n=1 Tax=Pseudomarimonas salicorniae TaxID=2933270 RepID=A0ABT0GG67_9GAMM|nr:biopolymer transporter ExbD [Lysobacter sp. CAU 1642]MCK7593527.1 biopolymer transporter ExbD [Lysobacter sp. CAU 1642]
MAFAVRSEAAAVSEMNITPLVDVLLVLLVIFMLAAPVVSRPLALDLSSRPDAGPPPEVLRLGLDSEGRWLWQGQALPSATVSGLLQVEAGRSPRPVLQLEADPVARYEDWVALLAATRAAGFAQVALPVD